MVTYIHSIKIRKKLQTVLWFEMTNYKNVQLSKFLSIFYGNFCSLFNQRHCKELVSHASKVLPEKGKIKS